MKLLVVVALAGCVPDLGPAQKTLRSAIEDSQEDLDGCYAKALERDGDAKGEMTLVLHVLANGHVQSAKMTGTDISDPKLDKCLKGVLLEITMKPVPGSDFDIDYTLQLGAKAKKKKDADDE